MKDLLNIFKQQTEAEEFDKIRIGLASPQIIRSWSYGEVKKPCVSCGAYLVPKIIAFTYWSILRYDAA